MAELPLLLLQGEELSQAEEEGKVVAVPPVLRVAPDPQVVDQYAVEGLVDPPKGLVQPVRNTKSAGNTIALGATQEQKEARARDISKTNATRGGASFDIRALADITLVKVFALKGINAITRMSRLLTN